MDGINSVQECICCISVAQQIREETNTRIDLPSEGQNSDEITITGRKENCEKARERIQKIQDELVSFSVCDIAVSWNITSDFFL